MRPIKFRGKDKNGEYVYGLLGETISGKPFIVDIKNIKATLVDENSVSQLCGYDAEGNEVYRS